MECLFSTMNGANLIKNNNMFTITQAMAISPYHQQLSQKNIIAILWTSYEPSIQFTFIGKRCEKGTKAVCCYTENHFKLILSTIFYPPIPLSAGMLMFCHCDISLHFTTEGMNHFSLTRHSRSHKRLNIRRDGLAELLKFGFGGKYNNPLHFTNDRVIFFRLID